MKPSHKRTVRTLGLWPTIVCLCLAAPLLPTTNAKKEARNTSLKRLVNGTTLQDDKGAKVDNYDAIEVLEIPSLGSKPRPGSKTAPPKGGAVPNGATGPAFTTEIEPNNTPATAQALGTTPARVRGDLYQFPIAGGDVDVHSFTASPGDRVYAATIETDGSAQFAGLGIDDLSVTACSPQGGVCTVTCPQNITQSNDPNQCGALVTYPAPTTEGDCGTVNCSPASGSFFPVGTTTVTCTASLIIGGPAGDGASCTFDVTVTDDQPPSITCPANITTSNTANQCGAVVNYPAPTITDNCPGMFTATCNPPSGSFFPVGTTTVTCSVDGFGGEMEPTLGMGVPDAITFKVGSDKTAGTVKGATPQKEAGQGSSDYSAGVNSPAAVLYSQTGASDNGAPSQNFEASFDAFDCQSADDFVVPAGEIWNVTQVNVGGTYSGAGINPTSINVTFYDNSGTLPGATVVASYANVATFASGPNFNITLPSAAMLPTGTYWVSGQVNMNFTGAGQWFWSNFGSTNIGSEYAWRNPGAGFGTPCSTFGAGSTGCGVGGGVNRNNVFAIIGTISAQGSGPSCEFTVTVNDTQPPQITCPANVAAVTDQNVCRAPACQVVNYAAPVASDNCPGVGVVCNPPAGSCFPVGVTTVTCTATDASGNTATCSFTVTTFDTALEDGSNPAIILLWNSVTGQYRLCCNGVTYTGVGKPTRQGCVYTLQHNPAGRRVLGRVDKAVHAGTASIQAPSGNTRCTITDTNTLNDPLTPACQ